MIRSEEARAAQDWLNVHGEKCLYIDRIEPKHDYDPGRKVIVDMQRTRAHPLFAPAVALVIGRWAIDEGIQLITNASRVATSYISMVCKLEPTLPMAVLRRTESDSASLEVVRVSNAEAEQVLREGGRVGAVIDELVTGDRLSEFAAQAPLPEGSDLRTIAIVDRGQDVPGVQTLAEAWAYNREHPFEPPAHFALPFPCQALVHCPLPRFERLEAIPPSS